jgi:hypothetical protein
VSVERGSAGGEAVIFVGQLSEEFWKKKQIPRRPDEKNRASLGMTIQKKRGPINSIGLYK